MIRKLEKMHQMFGITEGKQCKDCPHFINKKNEYKKCSIYGVSHSEATDWAMRWQACGLFNKAYDGDVCVVKLIRSEKKETQQIDGQMQLFERV